MAKREAVTIAIGDRDFVFQPLTLAQVRSICEIMEISAPHLETPTALKTLDFSLKVIDVGLSADYPDVRAGNLRLGFDEFEAVATAILRQGGFEAPGEVPAAAGNASNGAKSTGVSPQRSAKRRPR